MSKIVKPEWGDTLDVATLLHSTRRQVNRLARNPSSGFPPAIDFGNCSRHHLASVLMWMEAKKPGNEAQLAELIKKRLDIDQKSAKSAVTPQSTAAPKTRATGTPTLSQVERRNAKVLTLHQKSGQQSGWSMKTTCEGAKVKSYRLLSPSSSSKLCGDEDLLKVVLRPKKTYYPDGCPTNASESAPSPSSEISGALVKCAHSQPATNAKRRVANLKMAELKDAYESGLSMDEICKQFNAGKTRVANLLHKSGAHIRKPGHNRATGHIASGMSQQAKPQAT